MSFSKQVSKLAVGFGLLAMSSVAMATTDTSRPNILAIWGDDIGMDNLSAYSMGQAGHMTPNIDRIAKEGAIFTDYYGENSCTAGRAAFITGQHPMRTGLTKVGLPGAKEGMRERDATIAAMLKPMGYMTGQFGKNHFGDQDEHLPTNHGFDEFFGNLYHLNAEEEPENVDYDKFMSAAQKKRFSPRGVIHSYADGKIEDTGPLTKKRMETVDEEFLAATMKFIDKAHAQKKPFFVWFNATRMHVWTHLKPESVGLSKRGGLYGDGLVEHDGHVGQLLDKLDDLGIADNTIVMYSTDNGAEKLTWPDGGTVRYRGEKNTTWEGGFRVPAMVRWPAKIPAGQIVNEMASHNDWAPTLLAAAGNANIKEELKQGKELIGRNYRNHLDGYNLLPALIEGKNTVADNNPDWPRKNFVYVTDGGQVAGIRVHDWKFLFLEQKCHGMDVWTCPFIERRAPLIVNLRQDPYESAPHDSGLYTKWWAEHMYMMAPAATEVIQFLQTFEEYPPTQVPGDWTFNTVVEKMQIWQNASYK
ncbi:arylsulfatase [Thalassotalea sp. HSM 43]|uniref:arylsulfatase n=1 Tax=Thalassotalea sp. HSM 43 TaxID=2552945 RepID=UPI001082296B|nr:sulfatase-like hydrolase/transferase [Thalassotalea sp. HSM 43]QBY06060.1 arylsulfatase [Thalassotalea sp. HSM 43]